MTSGTCPLPAVQQPPDLAASRRGARSAARLLGPAFVASVAFVDPGNFATNFAAGAEYGYRLAWVIVTASLIAVLVQYLTSKAGLATGHSLPELCRLRYGRRVNAVMWVQAEIVAMATDLAEFVGAAIGLHLVLGVPLLPAGLITAVASFAMLALEQRGARRFELSVAALLALVAGGFGYLFFADGGQDYRQLIAGLVPAEGGADQASVAAGIIGATVMPHVVYLHSALQSRRVRIADSAGRLAMLRYNAWDCVAGLGTAGLVNLSMLCAAVVLYRQPGPPGGGDLAAVYTRLAALAGPGAALAYGVALIASGLSSATVGTYAGQVVMSGFVDLRMPLPARRTVTALPSLLVLALAANTSQALIYSQVVLSFGIPFALVPLLLVTRDRQAMGDMVNRRITSALLAIVTLLISGLNAFLAWQAIGIRFT